MRRVAVSQRVDAWPDRGEDRDALDQRLAAFVAACGGLVFPVPNALASSGWLDEWLGALQPEAVVLSGGNDIGQAGDRDRTERRLLAYAEDRRLPVLGICRGMQMMGVSAGGSLKPVAGHVRATHRLSGDIAGSANSYHGYALSGCPAGFEVTAVSEDGEIEAIRHVEMPWEGWMWHPERERDFDPRDINRLKALLK